MKNMFLIVLITQVSLLKAEYDIEVAFPNLTFDDPVGIYHAGDGTDRLFVLEQPGRILVFNNDYSTNNAEVFLDIRSIVDQGNGYTEEGLLGLAFHPNYSENGYFYVNYTRYGPRRNVIARYEVSEDNASEANYESSYTILEVNQPYYNHNGGQMGFGPDDLLYISFGDGGGAGDPDENGQDLSTLLGTIIRIDIDNNDPGINYSIPNDNPFIDTFARPEIYAYGLRNTWRFSWDPITEFLWGADVGQYSYEEINIIEPGLNYGWKIMEGNQCYSPPNNCNSEGLEPPVFEYELYVDGVCSVTGGYVYRGNELWELRGKYIYGDWCTGDIWTLSYSNDENHINEHLFVSGVNITSFGVDMYNELLICANNRIYKIISDSFELGDINEDEDINILDVVLMINIILDGNYTSIADINGDEVVNVLDIVLLVNIILGIE